MNREDHPSSHQGLQASLVRLRALIRKEFCQIVRDPSSIAIAMVIPVMLLLLFGYGVSLDTDHVPVAIVLEDPGPAARDLAAAFQGSPYFSTQRLNSMQEALEALRREHFDAVVCLRADFGRKILVFAKPAEVQVIVNGSDANRARLIMGYAQGAIVQWAATRSDKLSAPGIGTGNAVLKQTVWFNEELRSRNFLVPGLVALIVTLIGALLTAMVMAREWERGTLEALFVTPVHIGEIIIGKLLPYFVLGLGGLGISVLMAVFLFDVPLRGSVWVLLGASSLFLLVALCMGLVISSVTKAQFVAGQVAMVTTFLPAFLLSGMIFDIASAPQAVRIITMIVPARYYVAILQTVFLAGNTASVIRPNVIALAVIAALFLLITRLRTRKRLS